MATWLTAKGKMAKSDIAPSGSTSFDPKSIVPLAGAPNDVDNFVKEFPFAMTAEDLKRGQTMYNANCALCHGAAGYANGKPSVLLTVFRQPGANIIDTVDQIRAAGGRADANAVGAHTRSGIEGRRPRP